MFCCDTPLDLERETGFRVEKMALPPGSAAIKPKNLIGRRGVCLELTADYPRGTSAPPVLRFVPHPPAPTTARCVACSSRDERRIADATRSL
jgi:hypothetical protein